MHLDTPASAKPRHSSRLARCCAALTAILATMLLTAGIASAETHTYIAAGDSITFGLTEEKFQQNFPTEAPQFFEEGPDHWFNLDLNKPTEVGKGVVDVNVACPSDTTNEFIGEDPANGGEASTEGPAGEGDIQGPHNWHPCHWKNVEGFAPHAFHGNESQLEEILGLLNEGKPAHEVRAITIQIGSGDELEAIALCTREVTHEFETEGKSKWPGAPEEAVVACIAHTALTETLPHVVKNLNDIIGRIDSTEPGGGHYKGALILVGFYNPDSFTTPGSDTLQESANGAIVNEVVPNFPNVTFANPFPVFNHGSNIRNNARSAEVEQASICKYTEMCNPTQQVPGGQPAGKDGDTLPSIAGFRAMGTLINKAWLSNPAK